MAKKSQSTKDFKNVQRQKKKSSATMTKTILYAVALVFLLLFYFLIGRIGRDNDTQNELRTLQFRKDAELHFNDPTGIKLLSIDIEIADDDNARAQGLMNRAHLGENEGMLFIFNRNYPRVISMWMKNTLIPLDMIFVRQDKTISEIVTHTVPLDETTIFSKEPISYVIEVNAGFTEKYGIEEGFIVSWE